MTGTNTAEQIVRLDGPLLSYAALRDVHAWGTSSDTCALVGNWLLWTLLILDGSWFALGLVRPEIRLPSLAYVVVAMAGLLIAGFRVFQEQEARLPGSEKAWRPTLAIQVVEGHEYEYDMVEQASSRKPAARDKAQLTTHVRIENSSEVDAVILAASCTFDERAPLSFMLSDCHAPGGDEIKFPYTVPGGAFVHLDLVNRIYPFGPMTDGQVAAGVRDLLKSKKGVSGQVRVEVDNPQGEAYTYEVEHQFSLVPLATMYLEHWDAIGRQDLVQLGRGGATLKHAATRQAGEKLEGGEPSNEADGRTAP